MSKWLLRGLVFAALMVVVRLVQGTLINQFETQALLISVVAVAVFALVAVLWGLADGRADARANPDPDRREDLAMTWLLAGLVAGLVSGVVCWVVSFLYPALYVGGILEELTTFAAFTALLVFLPGITAVAVGRYLVDRKAEPFVRRPNEGEDVFSTVSDDTERTTEIPVVEYPGDGGETATEQQGSPVLLAKRDEPTEQIDTDEDKTDKA